MINWRNLIRFFLPRKKRIKIKPELSRELKKILKNNPNFLEDLFNNEYNKIKKEKTNG